MTMVSWKHSVDSHDGRNARLFLWIHHSGGRTSVALCYFFFFFPWLDSNHHTVSLREITQRVSYSIDSLQAAGVDSDQRH